LSYLFIILDPVNEECKSGIVNVENQIRAQQMGGKVDEQQVARAMADPEIQAIMSDPIINNVIRDMTQNPASIQKHLANPEIASKIEKLIASGILRTSAQ
jgi:stress-induced-phosphoprotein 1